MRNAESLKTEEVLTVRGRVEEAGGSTAPVEMSVVLS